MGAAKFAPTTALRQAQSEWLSFVACPSLSW